MLLQEQNIARLEWIALNLRYNNPKEMEGVTIHTPGLLRRLWSALQRAGRAPGAHLDRNRTRGYARSGVAPAQ